jgi:flavin reductase (DIM6/NTAB) family NADH-FMN oxidoreductase RutF
MTLNQHEIEQLEQRYRATLMNALSGFKPLFLLGTIDSYGVRNLSLINSVVHIGANPFMLGYIQRPLTVSRHSYDNLKNSGSYTLNAVTESMLAAAHHASAKFETDVCEFEATGLRFEHHDGIPAPFVTGSPLQMALEPVEEHSISNGTLLIIGKVMHIALPDEIVGKDGFPQLETTGMVSCLGLDAYYKPEFINRYVYARPGEKPKILQNE